MAVGFTHCYFTGDSKHGVLFGMQAALAVAVNTACIRLTQIAAPAVSCNRGIAYQEHFSSALQRA